MAAKPNIQIDRRGANDDKGSGDDKGTITDTAAELEAARAEIARLKGPEARRKADDDAAKRAAIADGKAREVIQAKEAELEDLRAKLLIHEERETARVAAVEAANARALKALPKEIAKLAPEGQTPDALAAWLSNAAAIVPKIEEMPAGGVARRTVIGDAEPHPDAVTYATRHGYDPIITHNTLVKLGRLPAGTKSIATA